MISGAGGLKLGKFEQKPRPTGLSQAARPGTSEDGATSSIQGQCDTPTMPLSYELDVGLIKWIEKLAQGLKDSQLSANSCPSHRFTTQTRSQAYKCNVSTTEGRDGPEGGRSAQHVQALKPRNEHRPQERIRDVHAKAVARWPQSEAGRPRRGRPAPLCSRSSPGFAWKTSTPTLPAYN